MSTESTPEVNRVGSGPFVRRELPREIPDHEFPHIVEVDRENLRCICGATCDLSAWLTWLPRHGKGCAPIVNGNPSPETAKAICEMVRLAASPNVRDEPRHE